MNETGERDMFTPQYRDQVREFILELARNDPRVRAGALTGSTAIGAGDAWSDVDVAFGIADGIEPQTVLEDWTPLLDQHWGVLHHFDMRSGSRMFLLRSGLEVDVVVAPTQEFGARGPKFRPLFGTAEPRESAPPPNAQYLIGLAWLYVLHARAFIERRRPWQAEFFLRGIRDQTLSLVCLRLGEDALYPVSVDRLPASVTDPLAQALVRSMDDSELRRALSVATTYLLAELEAWDTVLCARLKPVLHEFGLQAG
jgi:hypothetical protein